MKILVAGEGGQGIQTIAKILVDTANSCGYEVVYMPHYGVEMRMGISLAYVQISKRNIIYPKFNQADILAVMGKRDIFIPRSFIGKHTTVVNCIDLHNLLGEKNLNQKSLNMLCLGIIVKELAKKEIKLDDKSIRESVYQYLGHKIDLDINIQAILIGQQLDYNDYSKSLYKIEPNTYDEVVDQDEKKLHIRNPRLCKSCGLCLEKCPASALSWSKEKINFISRPLPEVDINKCIACGICEHICPDCAISVIKK